VLPAISIAMCLILMLSLPLETWIRFFVWLFLGLGVYFGYSRKRAAEIA
jgi:APA family basic amino acid/polyamine antiporter